ncbi:MAG: GNAT family N-acetyltransferase [Pseudomonadota bacterium]
MRLETDRLTLTPFLRDDEAEALRLFTDPGFMVDAFEADPTRETGLARFNGYLDMFEARGYSKLAVRWRGAPGIIGYCGYAEIPIDGVMSPDLGYRLLPSVRGKGVATEAARAAIGWGFEQLGMAHIDAIVRHKNAASRRVLEKLGLSYLHDMEVEGDPWMLYRLERA